MSLSELQVHALQRILENMEHPSTPNATFTFADGINKAEQVLPGTENSDLLTNLAYKAGWKLCYLRIQELLGFFMSATDANLIKYAGRPKPPRKTKAEAIAERSNSENTPDVFIVEAREERILEEKTTERKRKRKARNT